MTIDQPEDLALLRFGGPHDLVPVIAQHAYTGEVLMLAYANREALERSLAERRMWFWSRSRKRLWRKGESSGNELRVVSLYADCDSDTVLAKVESAGPACHTGARTCFGGSPTVVALGDTIRERIENPDGPGYTRRLLADANLRRKKLGEEATELALACASGVRDRIIEEAADLVYHALVAGAAEGVSEADVFRELARRAG